MPQVDLETLFRGGSGRKIVCETLIEPSPDLPAESFQIPVEDEAEWLDRNAVLDRKQSTKGINQNPASSITRSSSSKRFKSKPSVIIGLPKRPDSRQLLCTRRSCRRPGTRFFPKPEAKSAEPEAEPESPKVSCIGRVRSNKAKDRCRRKQTSLAGKSEEQGRLGCWARFVAVFVCQREVSKGGPVSVSESELPKESAEKKAPAVEVQIPTSEATAPGLGGLKKFSSGRRSDSLGQVEMDVRATRLEPLDC